MEQLAYYESIGNVFTMILGRTVDGARLIFEYNNDPGMAPDIDEGDENTLREAFARQILDDVRLAKEE